MKKLTYFDGEKLRKVAEGQNDVEHINFNEESKIAKVNYKNGIVVTITSSYMTIEESFNVEAGIQFLSGLNF